MNVSLVMTMIAQDRPGLVEAISAVIADHDGNWVESRMSHLAGHFAGILRAQVPEEQAESLAVSLRALASEGLELVMHTDDDAPPDAGRDLIRLDVLGQDRPGIVREITRTIAVHGFNLEELKTTCQSAPMSGEMLFRATARLRGTSQGTVDQLRHALEQTADDLMVDVRLGEPPAS